MSEPGKFPDPIDHVHKGDLPTQVGMMLFVGLVIMFLVFWASCLMSLLRVRGILQQRGLVLTSAFVACAAVLVLVVSWWLINAG